MISVSCSRCDASFRVKDEYAGRQAKCPKCTEVIAIPDKEDVDELPGIAPLPDETPSASSLAAEKVSKAIDQTAAKPLPVFPPDQLAKQIIAGLSGNIEPVKTSLLYRFAIIMVGFTMLLLPLIYFAFVALVGYAVFYHAVNNTEVLSYGRGRDKAFALLLYLGPLVVGTIMVIFMFKPLLARPADAGRRRSLTPRGEPILYAFITQLCKSINAPMPKRIDVDADMNASASFRRGVFSMFRSSDVVLTIGMPLLATTNGRRTRPRIWAFHARVWYAC